MPVPVTITGALQIMFTIAKNDQTYAVMEEALVDAGFTDYRIDRQPYTETMDVTIMVEPPRDPVTGQVDAFPAESTLSDLATAVGKFGD